MGIAVLGLLINILQASIMVYPWLKERERERGEEGEKEIEGVRASWSVNISNRNVQLPEEKKIYWNNK